MPLPSQLVRKINFDIILASMMLAKDIFSGKELDFIYRTRYGIVSHGFDEGLFYKVHIKKDEYVLIEEWPAQGGADEKQRAK